MAQRACDGSSGGGRLLLAGTPLGDPGDASARLRDVLGSADVVAAEDTRRLARLARELGVTVGGRVVSFFEGNERARTPGLLQAMRAGQTVLVVTDAGMPSVSDPGYRLVAAAVEAGLPVSVVPGPSAVTAALAVSGLAVDRFCFEGFLPRKAGERRRRVAELAGEPRTMVLFEAPHRLAATLADLAAAFGEARPAAVCRELTKTFEEVRRGGLAELAEWASTGVRGEITLVVAGAPAAAPPGTESLAAALAERTAAGMSRKDAVAEVAAAAGVPRRVVYQISVSQDDPRGTM
jgi:16S rRNA (cytidine1402-2'-O)-methyltransferase